MSDTYDFTKYLAQTPWKTVIPHLEAASDMVARLDERMTRDEALAEGALERAHYREACASLWNEGALVHLEDLVLHVDSMDIRAPSSELTRAAALLRARQAIWRESPTWALTQSGIASLRGRRRSNVPADHGSEESDEHAEVDALIQRSNRTLETLGKATLEKLGFQTDEDWDEEERISEWLTVVRATEDLPPLLAGAFAWDAWIVIEPLHRNGHLGLQLVAGLMRARGKTRHHLATLNVGLRAAEYRRSRRDDLATRLIGFLRAARASADSGLKDLGQITLARQRMNSKLNGTRSNSKLPEFIDLFMRKPLVMVPSAAKALKVTPQAIDGMIKALGTALPREVTGRARFRAWGIF
jgi:acyl transferase domain-containing protein